MKQSCLIFWHIVLLSNRLRRHPYVHQFAHWPGVYFLNTILSFHAILIDSDCVLPFVTSDRTSYMSRGRTRNHENNM
jgi:hypothetical protein